MALKIAFFSFADIDNFGDILFSHIFKMEIEKREKDLKIDFYTPSNFEVENIKYQAYSREKIEEGNYDALLVFGGEVIHLYDDKTWIPIYLKNNKNLESGLPSDVIFDWASITKPYKAWISVGVRPIAGEEDYKKITKTISSLDYVSTRGNLSKKILENLELEVNHTDIQMTPDLGWKFPMLLREANKKGKLYKGHITAERYMVYQVNNITADEAKEIAHYLYDFYKETNIKIVLLPIIRPWEDKKYLQLIFDEFPDDFILLDNNLSILDLADILAHAEITLTSSLHGCITSLACGIPGGILNKWQGTKLQDLFGHQFRLDKLKHDIGDMPVLLTELLDEKKNATNTLQLYSEFMQLKLDNIFDDLITEIKLKVNA